MATLGTHLTKGLQNLGLSYKNNSSSDLFCFAEEFLNFGNKFSSNNYEIEELVLNSGVVRFDTSLRSFRISSDWLAQII